MPAVHSRNATKDIVMSLAAVVIDYDNPDAQLHDARKRVEISISVDDASIVSMGADFRALSQHAECNRVES